MYSLKISTLVIFLQEKIQSNEKKLQFHMSGVLSEISTRGSSPPEENRKTPILSSRIDHPLCKFSGFSPVWGDKDHFLPNIRYNQDRAADNFDVDHFGLQSVASTGSAAVSGRGLHRILLGRSRRRRRHRIANARR